MEYIFFKYLKIVFSISVFLLIFYSIQNETHAAPYCDYTQEDLDEGGVLATLICRDSAVGCPAGEDTYSERFTSDGVISHTFLNTLGQSTGLCEHDVIVPKSAIPEGVWEISSRYVEETTIIVDLTNPIGSIIPYTESIKDNPNPSSSYPSKDPTVSYNEETGVYTKGKTSDSIDMVIEAHDNYEEAGSFSSWTVYRLAGIMDIDTEITCDFSSESWEQLTQGTHYDTTPSLLNDEASEDISSNSIKVVVEDYDYIDKSDNDCFQYKLKILDKAGNSIELSSPAPVFLDESKPKISALFDNISNGLIAYDDDSNNNLNELNNTDSNFCNIGPDVLDKNDKNHFSTDSNVDNACTSNWSKDNPKLSWNIKDFESGISEAKLSIKRNKDPNNNGTVNEYTDILYDEVNLKLTITDTYVNSSYDDSIITGSFITNVDEEGVYEITFDITDYAENQFIKTYTVKYDKTNPTFIMDIEHFEDTKDGSSSDSLTRWKQLSGLGNEAPANIANDNYFTFGVDDTNNIESSPYSLGNGNVTGSQNPNHVSQVNKENFEIKIYKCTDLTENGCDNFDLLATLDAVNPPDSNVLYESGVSEISVTNNIAFGGGIVAETPIAANNKAQIEFIKSKYYSTSNPDNLEFNGKYKIEFVATDEAGNKGTEVRYVTIEPNQMDKINSTASLDEISCNNSANPDKGWKANPKNSKCKVTYELKDKYGNPLYAREIKVFGNSQSSLDSIHTPTPDLTNEAIYFVKNGYIVTSTGGIQSPTDYKSDNLGILEFELVSYAPSVSPLAENNYSAHPYPNTTIASKMDLAFKNITHSASSYPLDNTTSVSSYDITDNETDKDYRVKDVFNFDWETTPSYFQKNTTTNFSISIINELPIDVDDEEIILYIYMAKNSSREGVIGSSGKPSYKILNSDDSAPIITNFTESNASRYRLDVNLEDDSWNTSKGQISSSENVSSGNTYTYKVRLQKDETSENYDSRVYVSPFVKYTIDKKEVLYPVMDKFLKDDSFADGVPFYNQATESQGAGITQSGGNVVTQLGDEAAKQSVGNIQIKEVTAKIKEKIKKEILDLPDAPDSPSNIIRSLTDYGNDIKNINSGRSFVIKGDGKDLIIEGINGELTIGDDPMSFITYGGNIVIKANIKYSLGSKKPTIAFISLRNEETGYGGEIHVANTTANITSVNSPLTVITGSFISERGILAIDDSGETQLTEGERSQLSNQLFIEGQIIGGNTLGGGDAKTDGSYICPSFIKKSSCVSPADILNDPNISQKYDLNYIRRFVPPAEGKLVPDSNSELYSDVLDNIIGLGRDSLLTSDENNTIDDILRENNFNFSKEEDENEDDMFLGLKGRNPKAFSDEEIQLVTRVKNYYQHITNHVPAESNGGSNKPVIVKFYTNKDLVPDELR